MERQRKTAKNTSHNRRGRVKESKRSKRNRFGTVCIVIQTIASIALMIVLNLLGMIPLKYLILVAVLLFFFWCITLNSQVARRKKGTFGKVFSLLLTFCLFIGSYYVAEANDMISRITGGNYKVDKMIVAVRADDPAETLEDAIETVDLIASEHLEIVTKNPFEVMMKVKNAGAIFLGEYSSEPLGDYFAGPNHIMPTNGTARFFSPVSVDDFIKKSSIIYYSREALQRVHKDIEYFAKAEQLTAHANSIAVRFEDEN